MLSTLPSILNSAPLPARDGAVARAAREARTGFATLMQQQADLHSSMLRSIDRPAAAPARALEAAPGASRSPRQETVAEPAPRSPQATDPNAAAQADESSAGSRSVEPPLAEARATDRAARTARPAAATPAAGDSPAEQTATATGSATPPGDTTAALARRNRLAAHAQPAAAAAPAWPSAGAGSGADHRVNTEVDDTLAAQDTAANTATSADASQLPAWLQGQALVTGWRPAPPAPSGAQAPISAADPRGLATGPTTPLPGMAGAAAASMATDLTPAQVDGQQRMADAAALPAGATDAQLPGSGSAAAMPPLSPSLPSLAPDARPRSQATAGAAYQTPWSGDAATGPGVARPKPTGTAIDRTATAATPDHRRAALADEVLDPATATATATPVAPRISADPAPDPTPAAPAAGNATTPTTTTTITTITNTAIARRDEDSRRAPIVAATTETKRPLPGTGPSTPAATDLPLQGAASATTLAGTAAASATFATTLAGTRSGAPGEGDTTTHAPAEPERSAGRGSRLPPVVDHTPATDVTAPVGQTRGPLGLRPEPDQIARPAAPDLPRETGNNARASTAVDTPLAAAGPGPVMTPAALAAQAEGRANAVALDAAHAAEPGVSSAPAAAPLVAGGSAPAAPLVGSPPAGAAPALAESSIPVPLDSPAFAPALGAQISLFARDGVQTARLQLNPAEMGPITVQIALDGNAARVDFQADLASTREVIEASLPALAGALQEAGMTLAGGGVSQQPSGHQSAPQAEQPGASRRTGDRGEGPDAQPLPTAVPTRSRGLVDLVA